MCVVCWNACGLENRCVVPAFLPFGILSCARTLFAAPQIDDLKVIGEDGKASESTGGGEKKAGATPTVVEPSSVPGGLSPDVFAAANANESEMLGVGADTRGESRVLTVQWEEGWWQDCLSEMGLFLILHPIFCLFLCTAQTARCRWT